MKGGTDPPVTKRKFAVGRAGKTILHRSSRKFKLSNYCREISTEYWGTSGRCSPRRLARRNAGATRPCSPRSGWCLPGFDVSLENGGDRVVKQDW